MKYAENVSSSRAWSYRLLVRLGYLLPLGALALLLLLVFAVSRDSRAPASDLDTALILVAICLVPIAALAGIVLTVLALVRARRDDSDPSLRARIKLLMPIAVAIVCVATTAGLIWITLESGAAVR